MKRIEWMLLASVVLAGGVALAETKDGPQQSTPPATAQQSQSASQSSSSDRGQQVFNQNCSRCHNSPEGFSPNISGTIARHMRVRAGLSDADYKALMKFLNP
jgi:cytochrome c5